MTGTQQHSIRIYRKIRDNCMTEPKFKRAMRCMFYASVCLLPLTAPSAALAQDPSDVADPSADAASEPADANNNSTDITIVVTGSRVSRCGLSASTHTTRLRIDEISESDWTHLAYLFNSYHEVP